MEVVDAVIPKLQQKFTGAAFYKSSVDKWTTVELDLLLHKPLEIDRMFQIEMDAFWLQCELTEELKITKLGGIFYVETRLLFYHISGSVEISGKSTLRFSMILKISYL